MLEEKFKRVHASVVARSKHSPKEFVSALRTAITFTIADAFDLTAEEHMWLNYKLTSTLSMFETAHPKAVPNAVLHELETQEYSRRLAERESGSYKDADDAPERIQEATLSDWVDIFMEMVVAAYHPLKPMVEARVRCELMALLQELGIGEGRNARGARYLPSAVRFNLAMKAGSR